MAKRFTDSDKWTDKWFRKLPPRMKLLWCYMLDSCDAAGVFEVDLELYELLAGEAVSLEDFERIFENRILPMGKDKVWIKKFVSFQYGILSEDSRPHKAVLESLKKHGLLEDYLKGIDTLKDKDKDKVKDKSIRKGDARGEPDSDALRSAFDIARKIYPGTKNGLTVEWKNFQAKYAKEADAAISLLVPAITREIEHRKAQAAANQFVPAWKHFQTWINNRCWEQELGETGGTHGQAQNSGRGERSFAGAAEARRTGKADREFPERLEL